jgi:hypothetical protein
MSWSAEADHPCFRFKIKSMDSRLRENDDVKYV